MFFVGDARPRKVDDVMPVVFMERVTQTILGLVVLAIIIVVSRILVKRRLRELPGHANLVRLITIVYGISLFAYLGFIWGVFSILVGALATTGAIGLIFGFALLPWLSDAFAGIRLFLDPSIKVGSEVEIAGKSGRIIEMHLTRTKISGDECLILVPNRKFRDEIVIVKSTKQLPPS